MIKIQSDNLKLKKIQLNIFFQKIKSATIKHSLTLITLIQKKNLH